MRKRDKKGQADSIYARCRCIVKRQKKEEPDRLGVYDIVMRYELGGKMGKKINLLEAWRISPAGN